LQPEKRITYLPDFIVAAAILANCKILLSEDLQHEQIVNGTLQIIDPFAQNAPAPGVCPE
jgi:predicted nucleic acid-binding protein